MPSVYIGFCKHGYELIKHPERLHGTLFAMQVVVPQKLHHPRYNGVVLTKDREPLPELPLLATIFELVD